MLILKAHCAWKMVNVETSPSKFKTLGQGRERRLDNTEPSFKLLNQEQMSKLNNRFDKESTFISEEVAAHLRFLKKCEPTRSKGKGRGSNRNKV
jgi:hypothetical protein